MSYFFHNGILPLLFDNLLLHQNYLSNCLQLQQSQYCAAGVANTSISIAECHLVDRAWFCIELTRYLKWTFFNQYSFLCYFVLVALLSTRRSRVIKKFSSLSQSKASWPPLLYSNTHLTICFHCCWWCNPWCYSYVTYVWFIVSYDSANKQKHHKNHRMQ